MGTQQFCLKWNNHQANMVTIFEQLLSTEALVDVTIACDGLSLKAHKMVLSACSPYFQSLFLENPCKHPIVIMKDMKYTELKAIIDFMYRGEVNVSHDQLNALLKTAETLKVKGLAEVCGERTSTGGTVQQEVSQNTPSTPVHTNSTSTPILASTHIPTRTDSPTLLSKRKRGRPRKRSLSDSNRSDDEQVPPAKIKEPESPDIEEISADTSLDTNISENISSNSQTHTPVTQFSKSSIVQSHQSSSKSIQPSSMECQVEEPPSEDCDFELEPSKLMEQTLSTDVPKSAAAQNVSSVQISSSSSNVNVNTALVPATDFHSGQMDDPESPQDIKPVLLTFEEPPVAGTSQDSNSMMYMESSGVPAIPGTSFQDSEGQIVQHDSQQQVPEAFNYTESESAFPGGEDVASTKRYNEQNETDCKPYKCSSCYYASHNADDLHHHEKIHTEDMFKFTQDKLFKCTHCDKSFVQENYLKSHLHIHIKGRHHACDVCGKIFRRQCQLTAHKLVHLQKNSSGQKDGECGKLVSSEDALLKHEHFGKEECDAKHRCCSCPYTTNYITVLRCHERTHLRSKTHHCSDCGEKFTRAIHLIRHKMSHRREQPHMCKTCGKRFSEKSDLMEHRSLHLQDESHMCMFCSKAFAQATNLQLHLQNHAGPQPYKCGWCSIGFANKSDLTKHRIKQHSRKEYECSNPPKICPSTDSLKRRKRRSLRRGRKGAKPKSDANRENPENVNKKKLYRHECSFCEEYKTDNIGNLRRHERQHTGDRPFKCEPCGKAYAQKIFLQKHLQTHPKEKNFGCEFCGMRFSKSNNLKRHKVVHLRDKGLVCKYCRKTFEEVAQVTFHVSVQHGSLLPHKCRQCNRGFLELTDLRDHEISVHIQTKFPCTLRCGMAFPTKEALKEHKKQVHREKEKKHKCPTCPYATDLIGDFRRHSLTHTDEKPYKCTECGKKYIQRTHLKRHLAQHAKHRSMLQCDICGKRLHRLINLAKHKLTHS